ncbi:hypothetical protein QTP70_007347 [Hemibagrus guttatus]|uniref:Homeobox domain-containing protein n=1 Tax=Hemibagrus guttatus TaxID=175788 RepID=A0AAE0RA35_9TELE|nr:hypothetical protein QTP70_007347 [Hemibagrus guttatus]
MVATLSQEDREHLQISEPGLPLQPSLPRVPFPTSVLSPAKDPSTLGREGPQRSSDDGGGSREGEERLGSEVISTAEDVATSFMNNTKSLTDSELECGTSFNCHGPAPKGSAMAKEPNGKLCNDNTADVTKSDLPSNHSNSQSRIVTPPLTQTIKSQFEDLQGSSYSFGGQQTLEAHMKEKHPDSEDGQCPYCASGQNHPRLARGETYTCGYKPFRCQNLQSQTHPDAPTVQPNPLSHTHTTQTASPSPSKVQGRASWRCEVCDYETNVARNLRIHMTSEKHTHNMLLLQQNLAHMQRQHRQNSAELYPYCQPQTRLPDPTSVIQPDSLVALSQHLAMQRSLADADWRGTTGDAHLCRLCHYATPLRANFQLHCQTDKHLQRYQLAAHLQEASRRNGNAEEEEEWMLRCVAAGVQYLQQFEGAVSDGGSLHCVLCDYSTQNSLSLVQHANSLNHQRGEGLLRLQRIQNGLQDDDEELSAIFEIRKNQGTDNGSLRTASGSLSCALIGDVNEMESPAEITSDQADQTKHASREGEKTEAPMHEDKKQNEPSVSPKRSASGDTDDSIPAKRPRAQEEISSEQVRQCPFCRFCHTDLGRLRSHVMIQHAVQPTLRCPLCQDTLRSVALMRSHLTHLHSVTADCTQKLINAVIASDVLPEKMFLPVPDSNTQQTKADSSCNGMKRPDEQGEDEEERVTTCRPEIAKTQKQPLEDAESTKENTAAFPCWQKGCNKVLTSSSALQTHVNQFHSQRLQMPISDRHVYKYRCSHFRTIQALQKHLETSHLELSEIQLQQICGSLLMTEDLLANEDQGLDEEQGILDEEKQQQQLLLPFLIPGGEFQISPELNLKGSELNLSKAKPVVPENSSEPFQHGSLIACKQPLNGVAASTSHQSVSLTPEDNVPVPQQAGEQILTSIFQIHKGMDEYSNKETKELNKPTSHNNTDDFKAQDEVENEDEDSGEFFTDFIPPRVAHDAPGNVSKALLENIGFELVMQFNENKQQFQKTQTEFVPNGQTKFNTKESVEKFAKDYREQYDKLFPFTPSASDTSPSLPSPDSPPLPPKDPIQQKPQGKRPRTRITDDQLRILRQYFDINNSPNDDQIQEMANKSGLPNKVIKHWFRNTLFKERQRNKDSPYNFNNPPITTLDDFKGDSRPSSPELPRQDISGGKRSSRTRFTDYQLRVLQDFFDANAYPKDDEFEQLSNLLNLPTRVIVVWFQNARQKARKNYENQGEGGKDSEHREFSNDRHQKKVCYKDDSDELSSYQNELLFDPKLYSPPDTSNLNPQRSSSSTELSTDGKSTDKEQSNPDTFLDCTMDIPLMLFDSNNPLLARQRRLEPKSGNSAVENDWEHSGDDSQRDKRMRTTITPEQLEILYQKYLLDSNPTRQMLDRISQEVGLKKRVVQVWFQNTRARERKGQFRGLGPAQAHRRCPFCRALFKAQTALDAHIRSRHWHEAKNAGFTMAVAGMIQDQERSQMKMDFSNFPQMPNTNDGLNGPDSPTCKTMDLSSHDQDPSPKLLINGGVNELEGSSTSVQQSFECGNLENPKCTSVNIVPNGTITDEENCSEGKQNSIDHLSFSFEREASSESEDKMSSGLVSPAMSFNAKDYENDLLLDYSENSSLADPASPCPGGSNGQSMDNDRPGQKRYRTQLSNLQVKVLKACFSDYKTPTMLECEALGSDIGLPKRVVQVWFQNARAKEKKAKLSLAKQFGTESSSTERPKTECTLCCVKYSGCLSVRDHVFSQQHLAKVKEALGGQIDRDREFVDFASVRHLMTEQEMNNLKKANEIMAVVQTQSAESSAASSHTTPQYSNLLTTGLPGTGSKSSTSSKKSDPVDPPSNGLIGKPNMSSSSCTSAATDKTPVSTNNSVSPPKPVESELKLHLSKESISENGKNPSEKLERASADSATHSDSSNSKEKQDSLTPAASTPKPVKDYSIDLGQLHALQAAGNTDQTPLLTNPLLPCLMPGFPPMFSPQIPPALTGSFLQPMFGMDEEKQASSDGEGSSSFSSGTTKWLDDSFLISQCIVSKGTSREGGKDVCLYDCLACEISLKGNEELIQHLENRQHRQRAVEHLNAKEHASRLLPHRHVSGAIAAETRWHRAILETMPRFGHQTAQRRSWHTAEH